MEVQLKFEDSRENMKIATREEGEKYGEVTFLEGGPLANFARSTIPEEK